MFLFRLFIIIEDIGVVIIYIYDINLIFILWVILLYKI